MENSDSLKCFDAEGKKVEFTRKATVLGKELLVKNYICSSDGIHYQEKPKDLKLQLSILPTDYCDCRCSFCIAAKNRTSRKQIDLKKLESVLQELAGEDVIRGVSITGGEPFSDVPLLNTVINMVFDILGNVELSLNTNGIGLLHLQEIDRLPKVSTIHVSRHHYADEINDALFQKKMPSTEEIKRAVSSISYPDIFVMNCMLLRDYIGTTAEVHRMLEYANEVGIPKVSFIQCQPANDFCRQQMVRFEDVLKDEDDTLLFTRGYYDHSFCHCRDGVYLTQGGDMEEFYGRSSNPDGCAYCRGFVYGTDDHLRSGFHGAIIH